MKAQATVIAFALFTVAMIVVGALFLSLIAKTNRLIEAGRREIELLARKAQEDLVVGWSWDIVSGTMGYPVLVINNTGSVPVDIVQVRLSVREREGDRWPRIVQGPWVIAEDKNLPVGGSITIKANQLLDKKQIENWYRNNMTKILEARILTKTGNVFRSVYVPIAPPSPSNGFSFLNTVLFYWSAIDFMDSEGGEWWHGDLVGVIKASRGVDGMRSIDTVQGLGGIQLPKYDGGSVEFEFLVYLPPIESGWIRLSDNLSGFLAVNIEGIYDTSIPSGTCSDAWMIYLDIMDLQYNTIYHIGTGPGFIEPANYNGKALTATILLRPGETEYIWRWQDTYSGTYSGPDSFQETLEPGWYLFRIKVDIGDQSSFALKSIVVYVTFDDML